MNRFVWAVVAACLMSSSSALADDVKKGDVKRWVKACEKKGDAAACRELALGYQSGRGPAMAANLENTFRYADAACALEDPQGCKLAGDLVVQRFADMMKLSKVQEALGAYGVACAGGLVEACEASATFVESTRSRRVLPLAERAAAHQGACDGGHEASCGWASSVAALSDDGAAAAELDDGQRASMETGIRGAAYELRSCMRKAGFGSAEGPVDATLRIAHSGDHAAVRVVSESEVPGVLPACFEDAFTDLEAPLVDGLEGFVVVSTQVEVDEKGARHLSLPDLVSAEAARCADADGEACHRLGNWGAVSGGANNPDLEATGCEEGAPRGRVVTASMSSSRIDRVLSRDVIEAEIRRSFTPVMACREAGVDCSTLPESTIDIQFEIGPAGVVCSSKVARSTIDGALPEFVSGMVSQLRFPALGDGKRLVVTYPFVFKRE